MENKKIQFVFGGKRRVIYPGKMEPRQFDRLNEKVKRLAYLKDRGHPLDKGIMDWLDSLSDLMVKKLAKHGLVEMREPMEVALDAFCTAYIRIRSDLKPSSRQTLGVGKNRLIEFFGAHKDIRTITKAQVIELRSHLLSKHASPTVARSLIHGRQFLQHAVDGGIIGRTHS